MVYYGPDRKIGLKSVASNSFVKTDIIKNDTVLVVGPAIEPFKDSILFEHEYYKMPNDYPVYDLDYTRPEIKMGPLDKYVRF